MTMFSIGSTSPLIHMQQPGRRRYINLAIELFQLSDHPLTVAIGFQRFCRTPQNDIIELSVQRRGKFGEIYSRGSRNQRSVASPQRVCSFIRTKLDRNERRVSLNVFNVDSVPGYDKVAATLYQRDIANFLCTHRVGIFKTQC